VHPQAGARRAQRRDQLRSHDVGHAHVHDDAQHALGALRRVLGRGDHACRALQEFTAIARHDRARRGEHDARGVRDEELASELALQCVEPSPQQRARHAELPCGAVDRSGLDDPYQKANAL
jgi:hypothetical protein